MSKITAPTKSFAMSWIPSKQQRRYVNKEEGVLPSNKVILDITLNAATFNWGFKLSNGIRYFKKASRKSIINENNNG